MKQTFFILVIVVFCHLVQGAVDPAATKFIYEHLVPTNLDSEKFLDLLHLQSTLQGAKIIGLGEQTHGTREFSLFKLRMLKFLQSPTFASTPVQYIMLEANYAPVYYLDQYIQTGVGNVTQLLLDIDFLPFESTVFVDVVAWLREQKTIRLFGMDTRAPRLSYEMVLKYLNRVATPTFVREFEGNMTMHNWMNNIQSYCTDTSYEDKRNDEITMIQKALDFAVRANEFIEKSSEQEFREGFLGLYNVLNGFVSEAVYSCTNMSAYFNSRDKGMYNGVQDLILSQQNPSKFVIWSHNVHVANWTSNCVAPNTCLTTLASLLHLHMSKFPLVSFHLTFDLGTFASHYENKIQNITVPTPASPNSYEEQLASVDQDLYLLNMALVPMQPTSETQWMFETRTMREFGDAYDPSQSEYDYVPTQLRQDYDVVVFIRKTTGIDVLTGAK